MTNFLIDIAPKEVELTAYSSYEKYDDVPIERGKIILITGKPIYSSTYAFPEVIDFNSGGGRIELPDMITVRITRTTNPQNNIGELNYVEQYSDSELGIDEPTQFEAIVPYPIDEFNDAWNLIGALHLGDILVSCAIEAPETDISGYVAIIDIQKSKSWPLRSFSLMRHEKKT